MNFIPEYRTISKSSQSEIKEKNSIFIGNIFPVNNEEEINSILFSLKKKYSDATHHCYAFKLLNGKSKFSDDGEPHRTAGLRILNAIEHYQLTNVLLVVVRYYGGTKLGVGPLGKAYYDSALGAINPDEIATQILHKKFFCTFDFSFDSSIRRYFSTHKIKISKENYSTIIELECLIPVSIEEQIINHLKELTKGKIQIDATKDTTYLLIDLKNN